MIEMESVDEELHAILPELSYPTCPTIDHTCPKCGGMSDEKLEELICSAEEVKRESDALLKMRALTSRTPSGTSSGWTSPEFRPMTILARKSSDKSPPAWRPQGDSLRRECVQSAAILILTRGFKA
ncbi:hypothetical protein TNCV_868151 [Trichonephila clavipes]|nr:hypothetical protein TNCV_868151 [Trichonephila clavipes]